MLLKKIIMFYLLLLFISCGSKEKPPGRFIKKDKLKLVIVPHELSIKDIKKNYFMLSEKWRSNDHPQLRTILLRCKFKYKDFDLDYWKNGNEDLELIKRVQELSQEMVNNLMLNFKKDIYVFGVYKKKVLLGSYNKFPAFSLDMIYLCDLNEILKIIEKYFTIVEIYE